MRRPSGRHFRGIACRGRAPVQGAASGVAGLAPASNKLAFLAGAGIWLATVLTGPAHAQVPAGGAPRALITAAVDDTRLVRLPGNTRPEANTRNDRGRVADALPLEHMQLLLRRPAEREQALRDYLNQLQDRRSANYHRWLTADQIGQRYGLAPSDIAAITAWLTRHGFTVNIVYAATATIDFSGTAGAVREAFHSEIHALDVDGVRHIANMGDPQIPAALAAAVHGIVSLHDFRPRPLWRARAQYTFSTTNGTAYAVVPADLATIYDIAPLFAAGDTGQNQTIVVIEDSNVYSTTDWSTFRSTFGLSQYTSGSLTTVHPASSGTNNCRNPGVVSGTDAEVILDTEWASAAAPGATIELASCKDASTTFGGLIALQNLINASGTLPPIVSISYGECEALNGATANAAYSSVYAAAAAEGVSVFVAAGDDGAASCDPEPAADRNNDPPTPFAATHGAGVSAFASTPDNVAVGGTDFGDSYAGAAGEYWSATNSLTDGSALSYVPEIPWNDSCASSLITGIEGYSASYGSSGLCNKVSGDALALVATVAGSGGRSGCATGTPAVSGIVGGSCAGYAKPSWQSGVPGIQNDSVRDLPDVSLFAADGVWGHLYVFCWSDTAAGGAACSGAPSGWSGGGGTSFASPIMAGIQALVNAKVGSRQGNPAPAYYELAASQAGSGMNCSAIVGNALASGCVFHDVVLGDMAVPCQGSYNCYLPSGVYGALSTSGTSYVPAYAASTGWDFATGLGSVDAANLANDWTSSDLSLTGSGSVTPADLLSFALTVGNGGPQSAGNVVVSTTVPAGITLVSGSSSVGCSQTGQTVSCTVASLGVGSTAALTIVLQPGLGVPLNVDFTVSSANGDIDSRNNSLALSLNPGPEADAPLPAWALAALGAVLLGLSSLYPYRRPSRVRLAAAARTPPR